MRTIRNLALASASLLAVASPAFAQDTAAKDADQSFANGDEIVVQARRRDESVQEVPAVVNAVTAETINKLNIRNFQDVTSVVPGLNLTGNANGIGTVSTIRGVNFDVNASGSNGTIEFYQNDAPVSSSVLFTSMFDIGQVEVQRGPQGTLRGRASPSGSIAVTYRRPNLSEVGGNVNATVNDINGYNINGAFNLPLIQDILAVRVAGVISDDDGNRVHPLASSSSLVQAQPLKNRTQGVRASVRAEPVDGLVLDGYYQNVTRNAVQYDQVQSVTDYLGTAPGTGLIRAFDRLGVPTVPRRVHQHFETFGWQASYSLYGQKLIYVGAKVNTDTTTTEPWDKAGVFNNPYGPMFMMNATNTGVLPVNRNGSPLITELSQTTVSPSESTSHEIRLQNEERLFGMVDYVVGYMRYKVVSDSFLDRYISTLGAAPNTITGIVKLPMERYRNDLENSVFGNLTLHLGDSLEVSGGVRHIWTKLDAGVRTFTLSGTGTQNYDTQYGNITTESASSRQLLPAPGKHRGDTIFAASVKYNVTPDVMAYANFGTSWRPGNTVIGVPTLENTDSTLWGKYINFGDETSKSYELGIKSAWLDNRLTVNLAGYIQKFDNYAYRLPGTGLRTPFDNRGYNFVATVPVEVKGIEAEFGYRPLDNLSLNAQVSFADGKIKNGVIPCVPTGFVPTDNRANATVGDSVWFGECRVTQSSSIAPRWSGTVQAEYNRDLTAALNGYVRGLVNWKGDSGGDANNTVDFVKAYATLNLYAGVRSDEGGWDVSVYAKNLTNTRRVLTRSNLPLTTSLNLSGASAGNNYYEITTIDPREFGINLRYAFGSR